MQLYLVRHGDNVLKPSGKMAGHKDGYIDDGLSPMGKDQAATLATRLIECIPHLDALYTSTLPRARQTADYLAQAYQLPALADHRLREIGCNRFDGQPWPDDDLPGGFSVSKVDQPNAPVSPADGQESWMNFRGRVAQFVADIVANHQGQRVIVVCHGGVINAMLDHIFNIGPQRFCDARPVKASLTHLEYAGQPGREPWLLHSLGSEVNL